MKTYTNASNTARAAKAELSKILGLPKEEIIKGTHFRVVPSDLHEGKFVWTALGNQTPVEADEQFDETCRVEVQYDQNGDAIKPQPFKSYEQVVREANVPANSSPKLIVPKGATKGIKIEKDRAEQNGYTRPSKGGVCARIWEHLDAYQAEHGTAQPIREVKEWATANGVSTVTASVQYYQWRRFNGYRGRV